MYPDSLMGFESYDAYPQRRSVLSLTPVYPDSIMGFESCDACPHRRCVLILVPPVQTDVVF